jgi:subtilisin family serine protease
MKIMLNVLIAVIILISLGYAGCLKLSQSNEDPNVMNNGGFQTGKVIIQLKSNSGLSQNSINQVLLSIAAQTRGGSANYQIDRIVPDTTISTLYQQAGMSATATIFQGEKLSLLYNVTLSDLTVAQTWQLIAKLKIHADVEYAEPDYRLSASLIPNDPDSNLEWGMTQIQAHNAWDITTGSDTNSVIVGVIDSGVDYAHEDLRDNILRDNLGNIIGYDFANNDNDPMDDQLHGTHCTGVIAAKGNNAIGMAGMTWKVKIMPLKFLDSNGYGSTSNAIKSIDFAIVHGANILSNSWGGPGDSQALKEAISRARNAGILFVVAAGNGNYLGQGQNNDTSAIYPANYMRSLDNILVVTASTNLNTFAAFSNYGINTVHVAAPGVYIWSTVPQNSSKNSARVKYMYMSGTSMAAPHVAGLAALIKSYYPFLNYQQIKSRILNNVDHFSVFYGKIMSGGRINAFKALTNINPNVDGSCKDLPIDGIKCF